MPTAADADKILDTAHFDRSWLLRSEDGLQDKNWEWIILDRFQTPPDELARWEQLAPVIGIDEGGVSRNCFDFLIDILPNECRVRPNIADPSLLPLPKKGSREWGVGSGEDRLESIANCQDAQITNNNPYSPLPTPHSPKTLVSFGHEDVAGLGLAVAEALAEQNSGTADITLLWGGLKKSSQTSTPHSPLPTPYFKILETIPDLANHLTDYDLVITHYGITAFEALYAGVPVLLISPGAYHERLAQKAGFYSLGIGRGKAKKLGAINDTFISQLKDRCAALAAKYRLDVAPQQSLAEFIHGVTPNGSRNCPACGAACGSATHVPVIARFTERSYRRCPRCGIINMNRLNPPPITYGKEYFFEDYQKQYGKTYLEDFPHLTAMAKRRLAVIKSLKDPHTEARGTRRTRREEENLKTSQETPRLLDIGCAYGPFLAAAREAGFSPIGIDPSADAVRYVTDTLGIPALQGFFPNDPTPHSPLPTPYSIISLWYVIEHFRDCVPVLAEIRKLLKPGGVLAFATPSFTGISGRASLGRFLEHSPADHWTVWSPAAAKKALRRAGFKVRKIVISGHHPERFPLLGKYARNTNSPLYKALLALSKLFSLGDTFEVYAQKA